MKLERYDKASGVFRWIGLGIVLIAIHATGCAPLPPPSGTAARLNEPRKDHMAEREAGSAEQFSVAEPGADIAAYLREIASIDPQPILLNEQRNDSLAKVYAQEFQSVVEIVKKSQELLESYKDVTSFLNANFEKSEEALSVAVDAHDSQPGSGNIRARIITFRRATRQIEQETLNIQRSFDNASPGFLNIQAWITSGVNSFLSSTAKSGYIKACKSYDVVKNQRFTPLNPSGQDCILRPVDEHRRLIAASEERMELHKQAIANGLAYLKRIQATMNVVKGLGIKPIPAVIREKTIEEITNREKFDYAFDFEVATIKAPVMKVWPAIIEVLQDREYALELADESLGLFSTELKNDSSMFRNAVKIYGQISRVASSNGESTEWTNLKFKSFILKKRRTTQATALLANVELFPNYDKIVKYNFRKKFIEDVIGSIRH